MIILVYNFDEYSEKKKLKLQSINVFWAIWTICHTNIVHQSLANDERVKEKENVAIYFNYAMNMNKMLHCREIFMNIADWFVVYVRWRW